MGSVSFTYTFTGAEAIPSTLLTAPIQNWSGPFTVTFDIGASTGLFHRIHTELNRTPTPATCWTTTGSFGFSTGGVTENWTVGIPSGSWSCTNWDTLVLAYDGISQRIPTGRTLTVTFDGAGITPSVGFCEYGSEKIEPIGSIISLTPAIAGAYLPASGVWAVPIILATTAPVIALNVLCANNPPPPETISEGDWTAFEGPLHLPRAYGKVARNFQNTLWHQFCKCQDGPAGSAPPNTPDVVNWNIDNYYIQNISNTTISNTDIAFTLNQWINNIYAGNVYQNYYQSYELVTTRCPPEEFEESMVHAGLVGEGRFDVVDVVGFKVEVTDHASGLQLEGQPMYLWNMGWISILDADDNLIEEKRVTREGYLWFPCGIAHATQFTFTLKTYTELRVTELVKPAQLVLMS